MSIEAFAGRLVRLLGAAVAEPERSIASLEIFSPKERHMLLGEWNDTARPVVSATLPELFAVQAARCPDAVAVVCGEERLSYGELDARANQLAHHLRARGVGPEVVVGVCIERSFEMIVALLGILKAGGAYLPLEPAYPPARLGFMLTDVTAALVLTESALADRFGPSALPIVRLDADAAAIAEHPSVTPKTRLLSDNAAYVIYTSGSTGQPKGIAVAHSSVVNYVTWAVQNYEANLGFGCPLLTPITFDASVTSLYLPLLSGNFIVLLPEKGQLEILVSGAFVRETISLLKLTPAHVDILNQLAPIKRLKSIARCLVIGGEALDELTIASWRINAPDVRLINEYGPTETVVGCTIHEIGQGHFSGSKLPIGRPIWNTRVYVLDVGLSLFRLGLRVSFT